MAETLEVVCYVCNEILGDVWGEDGYDALWWESKLLLEHEAEYHD